MKKIILLFILIAGITLAQEKTLLNSNLDGTGWFGAPVIKITSLNQNSSVILGGRGGYIYNHSLIVGVGFYGLASNVPPSSSVNNSTEYEDNLHLMYGGFELGYVFNPMEIIHYSFNTFFGIGRLSYNNIDPYTENGSDHHAGESFFVIEPMGAIEINITEYLRLNVGISYRIATGLEYEYLSNNDLSNLNGFLSFNIGSF